MTSRIHEIFQESYRELRPRAPMPVMHIRFYPFANINNTIRLRDGELKVRLSDLLEGAPEPERIVDAAYSVQIRRLPPGVSGIRLA